MNLSSFLSLQLNVLIIVCTCTNCNACFLYADCSKSGEFNSITSHYRKRRSAVHSYPEDQRGSNDVPSQERPQKDSLDIRIDGVEGLMDQLKKTVKTLHKKVGY